MKIMKRWLALLLTIPMALGDCGSITVLATEAAITDENTVPGEVPADNEAVSEGETEESEDMSVSSEDVEAPEAVAETQSPELSQLPALHIGQLKEGEEFPYTDDSEFVYDLPVSFDTSDSVTLFVNYSLYEILEKEEQGKLVWSILRAEKGTQEGSTSLIGEKDDWIGFETVSDSPYFIMTENEDENGGYYKTVKLEVIDAETPDAETIDAETVENVLDNEAYNYYIRAAYYLSSEEETDKEFYAAATVPYISGEDKEMEEAQDDKLDEQEFDEGLTQEDASAAEDTVKDEIEGNESALEDSDIDNSSEDTEAVAADETGEEGTGSAEGDDEGQETDKKVSGLKLDKKKVTMHVNESRTITATIVPEGISAEISWRSSNERVAAVISNGMITADSTVTAQITANAIGTAQITAECGDITTVIKVDVVEEMHDLSKDIKIDGFKRESDDLVYTGDKITQNIRVYHKDKSLNEYIPLTEKVDYTLVYKNNVNAAAYNSAKAPSITINFRGQYSGSVTLYYTIKPLDINDVNIYKTNADNTNNDNTDGDNNDKDITAIYEQAVTYAKNLKIPAPELTFGKKKLTLNKDFVCDYTTLPGDYQKGDYKKGDSYEEGKVYNYTVRGTGNFTGSFPMQLVVLKDKNFNFSSAAVTLGQKKYEYKGTPLSKSDVTVEKLAFGRTVLDKKLYDYEVCADAVDGSYVIVYPTADGKKAGYRGSKRVNLKLIGDRDIKNAVPGDAWEDRIIFSQKTVDEDGGIFQEEEGILAFGSGEDKEPLVEGKDYAIKYSNAKKAGRVTVTFTGKGRYKGMLRKTYEITPNNDNEGLKIIWKNVKPASELSETISEPLVIAYQKGGAVPEFELTDSDNNVLKVKTDYTVTLKNNRTPNETMSLEINGKGNYKGYKKTYQIYVKNGDIGNATILVQDVPYNSAKPDALKSTKITIKDNGKMLTAGKDYDRNIEYSVKDWKTLSPGDSVTVTVKGIGAYEGSSALGSYKIYDQSKNINKLKIVIDPQEYTGAEVELSSKNIHVYATSADVKNKKELTGNSFSVVRIVEYMNNTKSGNAKVTLRGVGEYGGMRTCSFKINKKSYSINRVKGITLDPAVLSMKFQDSEEKRTITAKITPEMQNKAIWNSTVIWSVSNSSIATVTTRIIDDNTIAGVIIPKKEGTVTITATAQDGNKKAQCKVTIVDAPVLKDADRTIERKVGENYKLEFEGPVNLSNVEFESSNSEIVNIDNNGLLTMKKVGAARIKVYTNKRKYFQQCFVIVTSDTMEDLPIGRAITYEQEPGTLDDTPAINAILREWERDPDLCDYLYIPAGVYWIDVVNSFGGIVLTDNQTLIMSPGALLMVIPNGRSDDYHAIYAFDRDNVTISGGQLIGDRDEHIGTGGESGHGISIDGCTNVKISDMDISKCWGDGIYLGAYSGTKASSDHITIENCNLHHNRRSNLSITDANNVTIDNCQFNYAKGTDPQYGIDIEPVYRTAETIIISNSKFIGNAKGSMGIITSANNVTLDHCTLDGAFYNMAGKNVVLKGGTTIKGDVVDRTGGIRRE